MGLVEGMRDCCGSRRKEVRDFGRGDGMRGLEVCRAFDLPSLDLSFWVDRKLPPFM